MAEEVNPLESPEVQKFFNCLMDLFDRATANENENVIHSMVHVTPYGESLKITVEKYEEPFA